MAVIKRNTCVITALNSRGVGTSTLDLSEPIELPYTLPGETVEFETHVYRNKLSYNLSKIFHLPFLAVPTTLVQVRLVSWVDLIDSTFITIIL